MQKQAMLSLFKPHKKVKTKSFLDFLDDKGKRNFFKHRFWFECSKATDETCINTDCKHNYLDVHENPLYVDLMQEIQAERLELEKKIEMQRKKYGYI